MRATIRGAALALAACAPAVMDEDLALAERFELVAFRDEDGDIDPELFRWHWPLTIQYVGPPEYKADVIAHMRRLGQLTGLPTGEDDMFAKMRVAISDRDTGSECWVQHGGNGGRVYIRDDLSPRIIRQCIVQEMTQALGLCGDLGDWANDVSRSDTVFASFQVADQLPFVSLARPNRSCW